MVRVASALPSPRSVTFARYEVPPTLKYTEPGWPFHATTQEKDRSPGRPSMKYLPLGETKSKATGSCDSGERRKTSSLVSPAASETLRLCA